MGHYDKPEQEHRKRAALQEEISKAVSFNINNYDAYSKVIQKAERKAVSSGFNDYIKSNNIRGMPNNIPRGNTSNLAPIPVGNSADLFKDVSPVLKHTEGKAEGARYCFISSLVKISQYSEDSNLLNLSCIVDEMAQGDYLGVPELLQSCQRAFASEKEFWDGLIALRVQAISSGKYALNSYKEPINVDLLVDAIARHLISYLFVDIMDEDSGQNHLCHIGANAIMIHHHVGDTL